MSSARSRRGVDGHTATIRFVLYVEGPRDRDVLRGWSAGTSAALARDVMGATVILGGRQPARATEHFRNVCAGAEGARGLCLLDRDGDGVPAPVTEAVEGLEFFTWSRRHIESYLLVPAAIRRSLVRHADRPRLDRVERFLRQNVPLDDENAFRQLDAKRLFTADGELSRAAGRPVAPGRVARAMHETELHPDVLAVLSRLREGFDGR